MASNTHLLHHPAGRDKTDGRLHGACLRGRAHLPGAGFYPLRNVDLPHQPFSDPEYFWPRPSASADFAYNPLASGGSNSGPTNPDFLKTVAGRVRILHRTGITGTVPADMVQASASGLDPHITPESALLQIPRVAKARGISEEKLHEIVNARIEKRQFGFLGALRVNVLVLNLELDRL